MFKDIGGRPNPAPVGGNERGKNERIRKMKKLMMACAMGAMSFWLAGCGGAPSVSDFEAKLKEYNSKIDVKMPDQLISASVEVYKNASSENQQKQYDSLLKQMAELDKKAK